MLAIPFTLTYAGDMANLGAEALNERTGHLTGPLRFWYANRDSDSVRIQNLRKMKIEWASLGLAELVYDVQPEQRIQLQVGEYPAEAVRFTKGAYDFYSRSRKILEPGSKLTFEREELVTDGRQTERYFGDFDLVIAVSSLAKALHERSQLAVVDSQAK